MTEGTQPLRQEKKTKASKRDLASLKKVRNFVARYSDDVNEGSFFEAEKTPRQSSPVLNSELESKDAPFVIGQGEMFKIVDDESLELQEQIGGNDSTPIDLGEAFKLDEHSWKPEEQGMRNTPFAIGQGEAFKILDEDGPDFQMQGAAEAAAPAEDIAVFSLVNNGSSESLKARELEAPVATESNAEHSVPFVFMTGKKKETDESFSSEEREVGSQLWGFSSATSGTLVHNCNDIDDPSLHIEEISKDEFLVTTGRCQEEDELQLPIGQYESSLSLSVVDQKDEKLNLDPCLVSFLDPDSFESDQYRVLRALVERLKEEQGHAYILAVTSPSAGDGKSTTALNLAGAFAQNPHARVLLVDADLCRAVVLKRLGEDSIVGKGLIEALRSPRVRLKNIIVQYSDLNLTVLPVGRTLSSSYEALSSPRLGFLLDEARREYDYIVLDIPSVLSIPDYQLVENCVDGIFVVVAAHKTSRKLVKRTLSVMSEEKILGLIFNEEDAAVQKGKTNTLFPEKELEGSGGNFL